MPVSVRNLTDRTIHLPLNSGPYLRLSPGALSESLPDVEVQQNAKVDKLVSLRAIALEPLPERKGKGKADDGDPDEKGPRKGAGR